MTILGYHIISKKEFEAMESQLRQHMAVADTAEKRLVSRDQELEKLMGDNDALQLELEKAKQLLAEKDEQLASYQVTLDNLKGDNKVSLIISDDMQTVTPKVTFNDALMDYMTENGLVNFANTQQATEMSVQLLMMDTAHEALGEIVEKFIEDVKE